MVKSSSFVSLMAVVSGFSVTFAGCSAGSDGNFVTSTTGEFADKKFAYDSEQTASSNSVEGIQAQRRTDNAFLIAALAGLENSISELRKRDNELADKIADVDKTLGERIAVLETRVGVLETQDEKFAAILEAVRGDITDLEKEDIRLAHSILDNTKLITGLRSEFDQNMEEFSSKVSEIIKGDPDLKARFETADQALKAASDSYKSQLNAAKEKAEKDLAAASAAHQAALQQAKDGYLGELEVASKKYQLAIDELRTTTKNLDKKFTAAGDQFKKDIDALGETDKAVKDSINALRKDLDASDKKSEANHTTAMKAVEELGKTVAATYATKAELQAVRNSQKTLRSAMLLLNGVPDKEASDKLLKDDPALTAAVNRVVLTLDNAQADHQKIQDYRSDFNKFKGSVDAALQTASDQINAGNADVALLQKLTGEMARTSILIASGEKAVSEGITRAIEKVKSGEMTQKDFEILQSEFASSLEARQSYEAQTQGTLETLGKRLTDVEVKASLALDRATAAGRDIGLIKEDISKLYKNDADLEKKITAVNDRLTSEMTQINNKVNSMLDGRTPKEFADQFRATATLAAQTSTDLASVTDVFKGRLRALEEFKTQAVGDIAALEMFQYVMTAEMPKAISAIQDFTGQHWAAVAKVIQTLAPFQAAGNSPASQIAVAFKRMALQQSPVCGFNPNADFPSLNGEDYFAVLGVRYLEAIVYEESSQIRSNPIFFGIPKIAGRDSLLGQSLAPLFESRFKITKPDGTLDESKRAAVQQCEVAINSWVAEVLYGDLGHAFRLELLANGSSLKEILQTMVGIARQADSPLSVITQFISGKLPNAVRTLLAEVAAHAKQIIELQSKSAALDKQLNEQNGIAQKLAAAEIAIGNLAQTDSSLKLSDEQLNGRINDLKKTMNTEFEGIRGDIAGLGDSFKKFRHEQSETNIDLYSMISAIALKQGLSDIAADAARKASTVKAPKVIPSIPKNGSTVGLGMSGAGIDLMTKPMTGTTFKCSTYWTDAAVGDADCINARSIPNKIHANVLYSMEAALLVSSAGSVKAELYSGLSKVTGSNTSNAWRKDMEIDLDGKVYNQGGKTKPVVFAAGTWVSGVWMVPLAEVITPYLTDSKRDIALMLISYGTNGKELNRINLFVRMYSPIVLNFAGNAAVPTKDFSSSGVKFDLDADGTSEKVGWINARSSAGFLAFDRNNNGKIDNGTELFGEATKLNSGKKATDGYVALQELDANSDGFVDAKDQAFGKLSVWFDRNLNGKTEGGELVSLKDSKVTKISVKASEVQDPAKRAKSAFDNDHKFESKFWGPSVCGTDGCSSYDIFFSQSIELSKK